MRHSRVCRYAAARAMWIRKAGAGRRPRLSFTDRVVITLVHLRLAIPHAVQPVCIAAAGLLAAAAGIRNVIAVLSVVLLCSAALLPWTALRHQ
jgi:hypothetical protein